MTTPPASTASKSNDIFVLPMMTLEELGSTRRACRKSPATPARPALPADEIVGSRPEGIESGISLSARRPEPPAAGCSSRPRPSTSSCPPRCLPPRATNQILAVVMYLYEVVKAPGDPGCRRTSTCVSRFAPWAWPRRITSTTRCSSTDLLYTGTKEIDAAFWESKRQGHRIRKQDSHTFYHKHQRAPTPPTCSSTSLSTRRASSPAGVGQGEPTAGRHSRRWWITPPEEQRVGHHRPQPQQNFALNLLMNPEIDFVTLLGQAGTGKTLLTLAASPRCSRPRYSEIIMTRVTRAGGRGHGLARHRGRKDGPWMGALEDNLDVLNGTTGEGAETAAPPRGPDPQPHQDQVLNFMRGRTFIQVLIVDGG